MAVGAGLAVGAAVGVAAGATVAAGAFVGTGVAVVLELHASDKPSSAVKVIPSILISKKFKLDPFILTSSFVAPFLKSFLTADYEVIGFLPC